MRKVLNDFIQKFAALFLVIAMSLTPCITGMGQVFADEPEGDGDVTYGLDIKESEHGKVEIKDSDQTSFKENDEVTLTVTPDDNYELEKVSVLSEDGTEITSATEGSEFTFTMPAANLSVEASFVEKVEKEVTEWAKCELSVQGNGIVAIYDEDDFSAEYHFLDGKMYDMEENVVDDQTVKVPKDKDLEICFVPDDSYCVEALSLKNSKGEDVEYTLDNELPSYTSTMEYKTSGNISLDVTFIVIGTKYIDLGITADDLDSAAWESQGTGQTLAEFLGFDGSTYVSFLKQHSTDSTYIGTPYVEDYAQAYHDGANGFAGWLDAAGVGMNCEGFVDNVLKNVGATHPMANYPHSTLGLGTGGWVHYINHYNLKHYVFGSKQDMLNSGVLEYGDIIWIFDQSGHNAISDNHHIGIFVGSNSHEDKWWDSIDAKSNQYGTTIGGNHIESIVPKTSYTSEWVVVKAGGETKGYAKVHKVSSNPYLVKDNLGGWIERSDNLSHTGEAWICENVIVCENAKVFENAYIYGEAKIYGNAKVYGQALVNGDAKIYGDARVFGDAKIYGSNTPKIYGYAEICGNSIVSGDACVYMRNHVTDITVGSRSLITFFRNKYGEIAVNCGPFCGDLESFMKEIEAECSDNFEYYEICKKAVEMAKIQKKIADAYDNQ